MWSTGEGRRRGSRASGQHSFGREAALGQVGQCLPPAGHRAPDLSQPSPQDEHLRTRSRVATGSPASLLIESPPYKAWFSVLGTKFLSILMPAENLKGGCF